MIILGDFEAARAYVTGLYYPLTENISADNFHPLANPVSMYYLFTGYVKRREQLIVKVEQLASGSERCSFYKALFLLAKRANEISFIFTLSSWSIVVYQVYYTGYI